jgi:hypothetical protein
VESSGQGKGKGSPAQAETLPPTIAKPLLLAWARAPHRPTKPCHQGPRAKPAANPRPLSA